MESDNLRYELKFVFDKARQNKIFNWLFLKTDMVEVYQPRIVNSIYFDNFAFKSAADNLLGKSNRNKYRLRWYNEIFREKNSTPFFEIKKKYNRLNIKEKVKISDFKNNPLDMKVFNIQNQIREDMTLNFKNNLILNDVNFISLFCSYNRKYFQSKVYDIRATVDENINYRLPIKDLFLSACPVSINRKIILEIKFPKENSRKVTEMLKSLSTSSIRHSKYVVGLASFGMINYI